MERLGSVRPPSDINSNEPGPCRAQADVVRARRLRDERSGRRVAPLQRGDRPTASELFLHHTLDYEAPSWFKPALQECLRSEHYARQPRLHVVRSSAIQLASVDLSLPRISLPRA